MVSANPFIKSSKIKILNIKQEDVFIKHNPFDSDVKLTSSVRKEVTQFTVDPTPKSNLYQQTEGYSTANIIFELSPGACQLFMYIALILPKGEDWIYFKVKDYCAKANLSNVSVYKYLDELANNLLIAKKQNGQIWINPNYLFNGDRLEYFKENCPECIEQIEVISTPETRNNTLIRLKKKQLIDYFDCGSYYNLKKKLGKQQIEMYSKGNLELKDIKLLR